MSRWSNPVEITLTVDRESTINTKVNKDANGSIGASWVAKWTNVHQRPKVVLQHDWYQ